MIAGSSNLWVPSNCTNINTSPACQWQTQFVPQQSTTYTPCGGSNWNPSYGCGLFLPYGSGSAFGNLGNDTVTVGDVNIFNLPFGMINVEPGQAFSKYKYYYWLFMYLILKW